MTDVDVEINIAFVPFYPGVTATQNGDHLTEAPLQSHHMDRTV